MDGAKATGDRNQDERYRWAFFYSIDGDLRFISHHDTLRLFRRAFARAMLPLRFSRGFNPQPRITIPLPRPVGVASDAEVVVVETTRPIDPDDAHRRLEENTPNDLRVTGARRLEAGERLRPLSVRYRIDVGDTGSEELADRTRRLIQSTVVPVERKSPKDPRGKIVDLRPYLDAIDLRDGAVEMTLLVTDRGTARPAEVAALLGRPADAINHRVRRLEIRWQ